MELKNVTTVEQLAEFMDAEAVLTGRGESDKKFVHGKGIYQQWSKRDKFPFCIFYIVATIEKGEFVEHRMKSMWFDEDGNVTERPPRNATERDRFYRND